MRIHFCKYQGAGNDFILLDNRNEDIRLSQEQIARLCDRHFGIGADGLMLLQHHAGADFEMIYYNADGRESTMCGNGGRCIAAFARKLGISQEPLSFKAIDGMHEAWFLPSGEVALHMQDVHTIEWAEDFVLLDTGSPHYVLWVADVAIVDVETEGRKIRQQERFMPAGINVNFVHKKDDTLFIRTYERGVEAETLACGTGITAAAIASTGKATGSFHIPVQARGGKLSVAFEKTASGQVQNIVLKGPAQKVFEGSIDL